MKGLNFTQVNQKSGNFNCDICNVREKLILNGPIQSQNGTVDVSSHLHLDLGLTVDEDAVFQKSITAEKLLLKDPSRPTNIYLFGPSTWDSGAVNAYYPNVIAALTPIPGTNLRWLVQPGVGGFPFNVLYNTSNRHSDGLCAVDYLADMLGMPLVNAFDITQLPVADGNLVNYSVSGATALGCTWNAFPNPQTITNVAGPNGIVDQVDKFLNHLVAANKTIGPNDLFAFLSQNINDLGVIATSGNIPMYIGASIAGVLTKMQQLYNLGARHMIFQVSGSSVVKLIPAFLKIDVAVPGTVAGLAGLSDAITDAYTTALSAAVAPGGPMNELDLIITNTSSLAERVTVDPAQYGFRSSLSSDPDPRYPGTPVSFAITSSFTGDGNLLTVTATSGTIVPGLVLVGGGVTPNTKILRQETGIAGSTGTYTVDVLQLNGVAPTSLETTTPTGPAFPFPTMLDQALVVHPTRKLDRKVVFSDDFHFTQTAQIFHAEFTSNFMLPFQ